MAIRGQNWRSVLRNRTEAKKKETAETHKRVAKKRASRKKKAIKEKPLTPDFSNNVFKEGSLDEAASECRPKAGQTKNNKVNWFHVQGWFIEGIIRNNRDWLVVEHEDRTKENQTWWAWKEKNCATRLLKHYGEDIVEKTVSWLCDNWQGLKDASDGRLTGAPNVALLWASRDRIFSDAKEGLKPKKRNCKPKQRKQHLRGEYDAKSASRMPRVGWGDDV